MRPDQAPPPADLPGLRRVAIGLVKAVHSLAFFIISASVLQICWAGLTGIPSRWTRVALWTAVSECVIFAAFRFRCPLRIVAEDLGAESGQVTDIYLPKWLADRITWIFTPILLVGLVGLALRRVGKHPFQRS
jgi:hypothetical protein